MAQSEIQKSGSSPAEEPKFGEWDNVVVSSTAYLDDARKSKTNPSEPQMNSDEGPSQATEAKSPPVAKTGEGASGRSKHRENARPAQSWAQFGTENIGYKAMHKLKQSVCDVVSHKKTIEVLKTKHHVLMEEVAQVHALLTNGDDNTKDEVQHWLSEADDILKEANGILEGRNNMADKKRLCSSCWDPTSSWEAGKMLRDIERILEQREGLDLSSYIIGLSYCNKLQSRENMLQEMLEALMDIQINMISIYGMIGVGKTILAKELARRAQNDRLFDVVVTVQVSESMDVMLFQSQIANKIGLQLSDGDDEETRARLLFNALEEKIMERGKENDAEPVQRSKILVILDGLQGAIELEKLGIPYGLEGRASCKVVLISRSADVCNKIVISSPSQDECQFKMHDIIQDVVISALSQGDDILPVLLDAGTCWHTRKSYENCIAISVPPDGNDKCLLGLELHKLQALLLKDRPSLSLPDNYFQGMQNLRILDIYGTTFVELPSSIGNLKSLVALHLECCKIKCLSSISKLDKLEVLSLRGSKVQYSLVEIGNLINLRVLDITRCTKLIVGVDVDVDVLIRLVQLRELYVRGSSRFWTELTKLNSILDLEVLEIDIAPRQLSPGALRYPCLRRVIICIEDHPSLEEFNSFSHVLVFNGNGSFQLEESGLIHLLQWTEMLQIKNARGLRNGVGNLSIHGFLQLKKMDIERCFEMECIVDAHKSSMSQTDIFPELQILTLKGLPKLEKICCWPPSCSSFPKLRELTLQDLSQLHPHALPIQLATKLRYLKVIDCESLLFIFPASETNGTERIVKLPCLEKLELMGLRILQAIQEPSNASIKVDGLERPCQVLFNDKIEFPSLKYMRLVGLNGIKKLWDQEPYGKTLGFGSLKSLKVVGCGNLECLFSTSIIDSLLQLEELEVRSCGILKAVFTSHAEDDARPSKMKLFSKLQTLKLVYLKTLQCFYRGSFVLEFPALRVLELCILWEMKSFIDPVNTNAQSFQTEHTLFSEEIIFPSLEHLQVPHMNVELIQGHQDITIFPNLSSLTLKELPYLKSTPEIKSKKLRVICLEYINCIKVPSSIWPINMPPILAHNLEELTLSGCNYQQELVDKHSLIDTELLSSLRNLKLTHLKLRGSIQWNVLRNLRSLILHNLDEMASLISTSLIVGGNVLHHLEYMELYFCRSMQVIISDELEVDEDFVKYGVTLFPSLKHIRLIGLPNLELFSRGSYEALFPSLETVEIFQCVRLQSFSLGTIRTPRLTSLKFDHKTQKINTFDDLNVILKEKVADRNEEERRWGPWNPKPPSEATKPGEPNPAKGTNAEHLVFPKAMKASATVRSLKGVATEEWGASDFESLF